MRFALVLILGFGITLYAMDVKHDFDRSAIALEAIARNTTPPIQTRDDDVAAALRQQLADALKKPKKEK